MTKGLVFFWPPTSSRLLVPSVRNGERGSCSAQAVETGRAEGGGEQRTMLRNNAERLCLKNAVEVTPQRPWRTAQQPAAHIQPSCSLPSSPVAAQHRKRREQCVCTHDRLLLWHIQLSAGVGCLVGALWAADSHLCIRMYPSVCGAASLITLRGLICRHVIARGHRLLVFKPGLTRTLFVSRADCVEWVQRT